MSVRAGTAFAVTGVLTVTMLVLAHSVHQHDAVDLLSGLPRDGIVAADEHGPRRSGPWLVTSGTLLTRDGELWSGIPDAGPPAPTRGRTGSAVLRAVSTRHDFHDVQVHLRVRTAKLSATSRTPARAWDGVHVFLRYRDQDHLYSVDLQRRDGTLTIKRKSGGYKTLAQGHSPAAVSARLHTFDISAIDTPAGPRISLAVDDRVVLQAVDHDRAALRGPGRVGLRGDNAEFTVGAFRVDPR